MSQYETITNYFGSKISAAQTVWRYLGHVDNYIEPFFGIGGVYFRAEYQFKRAIINDLNCFIANLFRSIKYDADAVCHWAAEPVFEVELEARHRYLVNQPEFLEKMRTDPDYYDPKIAGWWVWGSSAWIGSGWCSDKALKTGKVTTQKPIITGWHGINRETHQGTTRQYLRNLQEKLKFAYVYCGDWSRCVAEGTFTAKDDETFGILLDPPYCEGTGDFYTHDDRAVGNDVFAWAVANGERKNFRIAVCGYEGHYNFPAGWTMERWKSKGGYGNQANGQARQNSFREAIWFSPHCVRQSLFDMALFEMAAD